LLASRAVDELAQERLEVDRRLGVLDLAAGRDGLLAPPGSRATYLPPRRPWLTTAAVVSVGSLTERSRLIRTTA